MSNSVKLLVALAGALLCAAVIAQEKPESTRVADLKKAIDASNARWCEANRTNDGALLGSLFAPDGAFLLGKGRILQGPENIAREFGKFLSTHGPFEMTITTASVWLIDSIGYEYGTYTRKPLQPGADTTTQHGRYFELWKQMPDGSWKIWRDAGLPE